MPAVRLTDAIIPEVYSTYSTQNIPEKSAFYASGVVTQNEQLNAKANSGGNEIELPYWNDIDPDREPNYSSDDPSSKSIPEKIDSGSQKARICYLNHSLQAMDLVSELAGSNPMQRIANRFDTYWTRQWQRRVISTAYGLLMENIANRGSDMVIDKSIEDGEKATEKNIFSRNAFTSSAFTLGDAFANLGSIAVHSAIFRRMVDNDDIEYIKDSTGSLSIPTYLNHSVVIDDSMPVMAGSESGIKYVSMLFGAGAIGYGQGSPAVPVEVDRDPDAGDGGGAETIYERKTYLMHPFGYKFKDTDLTTPGLSATLADLRKPENWERVLERKSVPMAFLITNG